MARTFTSGVAGQLLATTSLVEWPGHSVSAWVRPKTSASEGTIVGAYKEPTGTSNRWELYINLLGEFEYQIETDDGSGQQITALNKPTPGKWHHILVTSETQTARMWVNGILTSQDTLSSLAHNSFQTDRITIGSPIQNPFSNSVFDGDLAEVGIWTSTVLRPDQRYALSLGKRSSLVGPPDLTFNAPILGYASPEPDFSVNRWNPAVTGTTDARDPEALRPPIRRRAVFHSMTKIERVAADDGDVFVTRLNRAAPSRP